MASFVCGYSMGIIAVTNGANRSVYNVTGDPFLSQL
jgi:hypothetical protein